MVEPAGASPHIERWGRDGALILSRNHLALLKGLLDRPNATAIGRWDWVAATRPYVRRYRGAQRGDPALYDAIDWLPFRWVERQRRGRYIAYRLLERGRGLLDGSVLARVSGRTLHAPGRFWWKGGERGASNA